ncbi:MAG: hypothetical protein U9N86_02720 [Bacteroidota bacterium]|nr:hypothetical protein [Bacteroidota bacterium]
MERIQAGSQYVHIGTEFYVGNPSTAIKLKEDQYLNYWDFTLNNTDKSKYQKFWGSGLFRYLDDNIVNEILSKILISSNYTAQQKKMLKFF